MNFIKRLFVPREEAFDAGFDWAKKALLSGQEDARSMYRKTFLDPIEQTTFDKGSEEAMLKLIRQGRIADNRFSRVTPPVRRCGDVF